MSTSIGIIGGADGPTAVFVTGNPLPALLVLAALFVLAVFIIRFFRNRQ